jgi:thiol-disulfide isomerase/thioredoxin
MKITVKILLLLFCACISTKYSQAGPLHIADTIASHDSGLIKGKIIPDFTLQTADGGSVKLSSLKGHAVLIDFWASWCMPCRASIPHLKELYEKYHRLGLEILSVSIDQNHKAWENATLKEKMPWKQAIDLYKDGKESSEMMTALGIASVPFVIILNKEGKVELVNPTGPEADEQLKTMFSF